MTTPSIIPFLSEGDHERGFPSTRKNQYVGMNNIHALHRMKNAWDANSPSITRRVISIERVGTKPTSDIASNAFFSCPIQKSRNALCISFVAAVEESQTYWPGGSTCLTFQQISTIFFDEPCIWCFALSTKNECLDIGHYLLLDSLRRHSSFEQYSSRFLGAGSAQFIDQELIDVVCITIH